jgi:drug/metabolite transporter (DMT)-like permease
LGLLFGILSNLLGGSSYVLQKFALESWPPATLALTRTLIALPLLFMISPRGSFALATRGDWWRMMLIGIFGLAAPYLVGLYGLKETDALNGAVLIGMEPITIVLLSGLVLGEELDRDKKIGIGCAIAGAAVVVSKGDLSTVLSLEGSARGNLLLAIHGSLWAIYTIGSKPILERLPATSLTAIVSTISLLLLAPVAFFERDQIVLDKALSSGPLAAVVALGIGVSFAAAALWNASLKHIRANQMAALIFLQPIAGAILSSIAGEAMPLATLTGGGLVLLGVYFTHADQLRARSRS